MGYLGWWAPGGIGRYDTASSTWISNFRAQSGEISNDDVRSLACDDANEILYSAYDTDGIGVGRVSVRWPRFETIRYNCSRWNF